MKCVFCDPEISREKFIFETVNFIFFGSKFPIVKGHSLLIPKEHIRSEIELSSSLTEEYKKVSDRAYKYIIMKFKKAPAIIINAPQDQSVGHLHKHFLPGVFGVLGIEKALREYLAKQGMTQNSKLT